MPTPTPFRIKDLCSDILSELFAPIYSGLGSILCFHRVAPDEQRSKIGGNRALEVTPDFLEEIFAFLRARQYDVISLDEVVKRLAGRQEKKFVCFTFDDGYLDTFETAYPIFKRHGLPLALYLTTSYLDGSAVPWWYRLEDILTRVDEIAFAWEGVEYRFPSATKGDRDQTFDQVAGIIRNMNQTQIHDLIVRLEQAAAIDSSCVSKLMMNWDQARVMSEDPIVTLGAHTVNHYTLRHLGDEAAIWEMAESKRLIESRLGGPVEHFSYPFGGRNAVGVRDFALAKNCGFKSMTTTRSGNLFSVHQYHLECLPRHLVSGNYQSGSSVRRTLSGFTSAIGNRLSRAILE